METITTSRLLLREWRDSDLEPFAEMNVDPQVVRTLFYEPTRQESDDMVARVKAHHEARGYGLWAVEEIGGAAFIGAVGLSVPRINFHFMPCVEVGWRLAPAYWGKGYATEAAAASLDFGFNNAGLAEVVSFTAEANKRSREVMERLGMASLPEDNFEHPNIPIDHPLCPHVLYRISAEDWQRQRKSMISSLLPR